MNENAAQTEDLGQAMTLPYGPGEHPMELDRQEPGARSTHAGEWTATPIGPARRSPTDGPAGAQAQTAGPPLTGSPASGSPAPGIPGSPGTGTGADVGAGVGVHPEAFGAPLVGGGSRPPRKTAGQFYREAWRRLPRDFGYMALTGLLLGTLYFAFPAVVFGAGSRGALWNPFTLLLFFAALFVARWLGAFEKIRIGWAESAPIRPVDWTPRWQQNWWARTGSAVANPHYWLYLLHAVVVYPLAAIITVGAGAVLAAGILWPVPLALAFLFNDVLPGYVSGQTLGTAVTFGLLALISLGTSVLLLPLWARGAVIAHWWIDHALLGGFRAEVLEERVAGLQASRAGAVTAEGQALRQIERDLHDGPQQRLVRLRMDLDAAGRAIDTAPETAKRLVAEASGHAADALDELRALSRGFAPPILLDRGLVAALEALCSRTPIPVGLDVRLPEGLELGTEIQRNVYFTVSELLTNTTKHAGASTAGVYLGLVVDTAGQWWLAVSVTDDGRGGASVQEGHGIAGLVGRMRALDGDLTVSSPAGGPTEASARIPLGALTGVPTRR